MKKTVNPERPILIASPPYIIVYTGKYTDIAALDCVIGMMLSVICIPQLRFFVDNSIFILVGSKTVLHLAASFNHRTKGSSCRSVYVVTSYDMPAS